MISPKLRPLNEQEREKAWEFARDRTAGPVPDPKVFESNQLSKYPPWMIRLVTFLALVVLAAGFLPSAYRLHAAGDTTFCETMDVDHLCDQVGYATVLLAEVGQVIFLLCIAVLARTLTQTRVFWIGAIMSTAIALLGNAFISEPWLHGGEIFKWMETFFPPLIVILVGYALKELLLHFVEERRATGIALKRAELERMTRYKEPEHDPSWLRNYSIAIRAAYRRANARYKAELGDLTDDEWRHLIKYAMLAGDYLVDPSQETAIERQAREAKEQQAAEKLKREQELEFLRQQALNAPPSERKALLDELPPAQRDEAAASLQKHENQDDEVWLNADNLWSARSALSGKEFGHTFPDEKTARKRVHDYNYRYQRRRDQQG